MFNGQPSPIMIITGKKPKEIYERLQTPMGDHTKEIREARERLRKAGMFK